MAEPHNPRNMPEQYEETEDPKNPPNSVLAPDVRRTARWSFLTPVIVMAIVAALAWAYFFARGPRPRQDTAIEVPGPTGTAGESAPGGFNPDPKPDDTADELKYRGAGK